MKITLVLHIGEGHENRRTPTHIEPPTNFQNRKTKKNKKYNQKRKQIVKEGNARTVKFPKHWQWCKRHHNKHR
jgi:hypothetical protein